MKKFLSLLTLILFFSSSPAPVHAQFTWADPICNSTEDPSTYEGVATIRGVECIVARVLNLAIYFVGIIVFIMLVFGAYKLLFSGGDPKSVETGRNIITYAILGLVLTISSWFILNFISNFTGVEELLNFSVILKE